MQVDPFVYPVPNKLINDPELGPFFQYFVKWAHDMWRRTGGSEDSISNQEIAELFPWQLSDIDNADWISTLFNVQQEPKKFFISASSNHTCYGPEIVEAISNITVTLDSNPQEGDITTVKRNTTSGDVTISGGTKNIDGQSTASLLYNYETIDFMYSATSDEWLIV